MQLIVTKKGFREAASLCLVAGILFVAACHKGKSPKISSPIRVSLCDLYENPAAYDGRLITTTATITQLQDDKYLYPGPSRECGYSFIKLDAHNFRNTDLDELESSAASSTGRKEFDLELTGVFDSKYSEAWEAVRYRITPIGIKALSPVRVGWALGAA
jgi:hypothetical protein